MTAAELVVRVSAMRSVSIDVGTGDVSAPADALAQRRMLLAGLGPVRAVSERDGALLFELESGEQWLVSISAVSGLVSAVEQVAETAGGLPGAVPARRAVPEPEPEPESRPERGMPG